MRITHITDIFGLAAIEIDSVHGEQALACNKSKEHFVTDLQCIQKYISLIKTPIDTIQPLVQIFSK